MAKLKAAGKRKGKGKDVRSAVPCLILLVTGFALIFMLFYLVLKSSS
jgi:hypothetical protein